MELITTRDGVGVRVGVVNLSEESPVPATGQAADAEREAGTMARRGV